MHARRKRNNWIYLHWYLLAHLHPMQQSCNGQHLRQIEIGKICRKNCAVSSSFFSCNHFIVGIRSKANIHGCLCCVCAYGRNSTHEHTKSLDSKKHAKWFIIYCFSYFSFLSEMCAYRKTMYIFSEKVCGMQQPKRLTNMNGHGLQPMYKCAWILQQHIQCRSTKQMNEIWTTRRW